MDPEESALANDRSARYRYERDRERDAREGMAWWNELPEYSRAAWLAQAGSAVPADAWEAYKRTLTPDNS